MSKILSREEAAALLKKDKVKEVENARPQTWPSTNDKVLIYKAAKSESELVKLSDGRIFSITYKDEKGLIFLRPNNAEFIPCGYFRLEIIESEIEEWI